MMICGIGYYRVQVSLACGIGRSAPWVSDRPVDGQTGRQAGRFTDRQTNRQKVVLLAGKSLPIVLGHHTAKEILLY